VSVATGERRVDFLNVGFSFMVMGGDRRAAEHSGKGVLGDVGQEEEVKEGKKIFLLTLKVRGAFRPKEKDGVLVKLMRWKRKSGWKVSMQ